MNFEFGILSLGDIQTNPSTGLRATASDRIDDIVGYGELADRLGIDLFALGEHHSAEFTVSSPAVVLTAIAARTSRVRLTSAVTVLSVLDPVRVYQDFATLDLISHGRAEVIAGRSAFLEPFALFGVDLQQYDQIFSEKLDLLLRVRSQPVVTWAGAFRSPLENAPIIPRAYQQRLPVWVGVGGTPASAERAGRLGLPMVLALIGGSIEQARATVEIYRAAGERAGTSGALQVGISTHFYAGESARQAREMYPNYQEYLRPKTPGGRGFQVSREMFERSTAPGQALMIGSSDELVEKILYARHVLGIDRFIGQVDWGGIPRPLVHESIARLANEIAPAVRERLNRDRDSSPSRPD